MDFITFILGGLTQAVFFTESVLCMHTLARELLKSYITIYPAMEVWLCAPCDLDYHRIDETRF